MQRHANRFPKPLKDTLLLVSRCLLAWLFLHEGLTLVAHLDSTFRAMSTLGVPAPMAAATIALQIGAGLAIALGWQTRPAALGLSLFCAATAVLFHNNFNSQNEMLHFDKDLAIAGGMCVLTVCGPGRFALESLLKMRTGSPVSGSSSPESVEPVVDLHSRSHA